ncbi:MAG: glycosyltransferase [Rhodobacterales bacterium]
MYLLMCAPAPVSDHGGQLKLDTKFVDGMHVQVREWNGPVRCVLQRTKHAIPFGQVYDVADLSFELTILDQLAPLPDAVLADVSAVMLSADMVDIGPLSDQVRRAKLPFVVTIEYTLATRLRILWLENWRNPLRLLRSAIWTLNQERAVRSALRAADGVQFNGYPAHDAYASMNANTLLYLDNRMTPDLFATSAEMQARAEHARQGEPLRLIYSGRLEHLKGSQDLPRLMQELRNKGVQATLDIYGAGSLLDQLRASFAPFKDMIRIHAPVDFASELVPINRQQADIFVSCHRQEDPSCSYLEAMGCGLAVAGYANQMWNRLQHSSGGGGVAPIGNIAALAEVIAGWDKDRDALIAASEAGLDFARKHSFNQEFKKRMDHVRFVT